MYETNLTKVSGISMGKLLPTSALISNLYPTEGGGHVVPLDNSRQYPNVPNMMDPLKLPSVIDALRKKTVLKYGTPNDTSPRSTEETKVKARLTPATIGSYV